MLKPGGRLGFTTAAKEKPHDVERLRERALAALGLAHRAEAAIGIPHKVSSDEVRDLFTGAGYRVRQVLLRTIVDHPQSTDEVHVANLSSSFGNSLSGLSESERKQLRTFIDTELEQLRDAEGIRVERHLIFAVAEKPQVS